MAQFAYIAVVVAGFLTYALFHPAIQAWLLARLHQDGWAAWLPYSLGAAIMFAAFAIAIFFSIPAGPLFYIGFGYFYGALAGTLIAATATTVGSAAAFRFFRNALPPSVHRDSVAVSNVFVTLLLLRSSPWIPNPLITLFCSAFDVGITSFIVTTFFGTMPLIAVYTIGASRFGDHFDLSLFTAPEFTAAFGLLAVVSVLGCLKPVRVLLAYLKAVQLETQAAAAGSLRPG